MTIPFAANDIFQCAWCVRNGTGQNQVNVQRFKVLVISGAAPDQAALADGISTKVAAILKPKVPSSSTYVGMKMTKVPTLGLSAFVTTNGAGAGTGVGDALAPQLCVLTSWRSAGAPARTRGRMYWPSTYESYEDVDGRLTSAALSDFLTQSTNLRALGGVACGSATTCTMSLVIHRIVTGFPVHYEVDNAIIRPAFATQRRRSAINRSDGNFI